MVGDHTQDRPSLGSFDHDLGDLGLHDTRIRLVLQVGHTGLARCVVTHRPDEEQCASSRRIGSEFQGTSHIERVTQYRYRGGDTTSYQFTIHTIPPMSNDTPDPRSEDSHAPFIDGRNELTNESVASDMDDHITTPTEASTPTAQAAAPMGVATPDDTGELEAVVPVTTPSAIEPAPFDYDDYYAATETAWPPAESAPVMAEEPPRKNRDGVLFFAGALAAAFLGAALTVGLLAATGTLSGDPAASPTTTVAQATTSVAEVTPEPVIQNTIVNELGSAVNPTAVAAKAIPSIVTVNTSDSNQSGLGSGSGVVISSDGYIVTNEHVVEGATRYAVTFEDGRVYEAELIGMDKLTDLAVLRISATDLVPIDFGSSDELSLGDPAVAVGNPLGQAGGASVSVGIVSAFDRQVDFSDGSNLFGMIQTDAAINSGSSGGALVNSEGELIGVTAAIGVSQAGPEGIGYAIPVELVERITAEIIETGDVAHPFLGVTIGTAAVELEDGATVPAGAEVITIEGNDSAAGVAGLEEGDVIVRIGDKEITSQADLILAVRLYRVGEDVAFVALRDGAEETFVVTMGQRPAEFGG